MLGKITAVLALAASCAVAGMGPAAASGKAPRAASENSPWFQADAGFTLSRANLTEHVLTPAAVAKVRFLRSVASPPMPPPSQTECFGGTAAPVLAGGDLYLITDLRLSKYNAATGKLIWRRTPDPGFSTDYASLGVSGNGLVVVDGFNCDSVSTPDGALYAYNAATGKLVWSVISEGLYQDVLADGYVLTAGTDAGGYFAYVLNPSDGKTIWERTNGCEPSYPTNPLVIGSLAMLYGCDSQGNLTLEARNVGTGALAWSLPGAWTIQRGDANAKKLFATDPAGAVVALNPLTGQQEYTLSQAVKVLAADNSRVYATCGQGQYVCAYDVSTGTLEWQDTQVAPEYDYATLAAEADGVLYLNTGAALNAATGNLIKALPFVSSTGTPATALAVGDGRIAAVSDPRTLDLYGLRGY